MTLKLHLLPIQMPLKGLFKQQLHLCYKVPYRHYNFQGSGTLICALKKNSTQYFSLEKKWLFYIDILCLFFLKKISFV